MTKHFRMEYTGPDTSESAEFTVVEIEYEPPLRGFGPKGKLRYKFTFAEWAKREEVKKAWKELAEKYDLTQKELKDVDSVFGLADPTIQWNYPTHRRYV